MDMLSAYIKNLFGVDEKVVSSIKSETWGIYVTNRRIIYLKVTPDGKTRTLQDFDYKHINHIFCESTKGEDYRLFGAAAVLIGLFMIYVNNLNQAFLWIGGLFLLGGALALFSKTTPTSTLKIHLSSMMETQDITLPTTAEQMDNILKSIAEMREKTTLQHDSPRARESNNNQNQPI